MLLSERLFVLSVVLFSAALGEIKEDTKRQGRHFLALLGYLHGYKIGQEYALQIPHYLITPVIIAPSVNQQQSVNIQSGSNDENYQESGGTIQKIAPAKIISPDNANASEKDNVMNTGILNDDIENVTDIHLPVESKLRINDTRAVENFADDSVTQSMDNNINKTAIDQMLILNATSEELVKNETNIANEGPYPSPSYDNQMINSLDLTTRAPSIQNSHSLPPVGDNRWQNFTLRGNLTGVIPDENNNLTMTNEEPNNTTLPPFSTEYPKGSKGPYPSAWYNNEAIDQLSITTNYYTNESPQANDGWGSYSMNPMLPSGFRPLAGLYYDGFLHKPVKKIGIAPKPYWN